jgi:phytoene synthase
MSDPFAACEEIVRRHDPDRYFATLFAPEAKRRFLFALYALYYELAHAAQAAREPMLVEIRLMWWRETIAMAREGTARNHDVARALVETLASVDLPDAPFEAILEARGRGLDVLADATAAERYSEATVGSLMRLALRVLGAEADVRHAAMAYALAGRGALGKVDTAALAKSHYDAARKTRLPRAGLPALMPAALVPLYLKRSDPPLWRKQIFLLRAVVRGRL